jgi:hypothetical protein
VNVDVVEELHSSPRLEVSDVLECGAASLGDCYPMFRDIAVMSFSGGERSHFMHISTVEDKSRCLVMSGTNHLTQHHNPEERRSQLQSCDSLKTRNK